MTTVLEWHGDFFRDFSGDTIRPSTIDTLTELGLRDWDQVELLVIIA